MGGGGAGRVGVDTGGVALWCGGCSCGMPHCRVPGVVPLLCRESVRGEGLGGPGCMICVSKGDGGRGGCQWFGGWGVSWNWAQGR